MQIREIDLTELYVAYSIVKQLRSELSYDEFDDLIYDMRHINYKSFGIFERGELRTYAGVAVQTTLKHKRHLKVFDLITDEKYRDNGYEEMMLEYLDDYAKTTMSSCVVFESL